MNVRYGIGAGTDPSNREMRLSMNLQQGMISRETARDEMDFLDDPAREELRIVKQKAIDSFMNGIYQKAQQGDIAAAATLIDAMKKEDTDINELVSKVIESMQQPATPEMPGMPGMPGPGGPGGAPDLGALLGGGQPPPRPDLPSLGALGVNLGGA